jgi:hypothetical protein
MQLQPLTVQLGLWTIAARRFCQLFYEIFDFRHNFLDAAERQEMGRKYKGAKRAILCSHPHGIIPIQAVLWAAYCDEYIHEAYGFGAAASVVCYIPFLCNIVAWLTAGPADYKTLHRGMTKDKKNLFILPGGVAEVCVLRLCCVSVVGMCGANCRIPPV